MCRSIKPLFNFEPPADQAEIQAAALQFVRKISGFHKPSKANEPAFRKAVDDISMASAELLAALETRGPAKSRTGAVPQPETGPTPAMQSAGERHSNGTCPVWP